MQQMQLSGSRRRLVVAARLQAATSLHSATKNSAIIASLFLLILLRTRPLHPCPLCVVFRVTYPYLTPIDQSRAFLSNFPSCEGNVSAWSAAISMLWLLIMDKVFGQELTKTRFDHARREKPQR